MSLFERTLGIVKNSRQKILDGGVNCIPLTFQRFSEELPGIEQKSIIQVTASTKVGKTQITDSIFLYDTIEFAMANPTKVRLKIFYFSLEMAKEQKMMQCFAHLIWMKTGGRVRVDPKKLRSLKADDPLPQEIIDLLEDESYQRYFKFFEEHVEFIDSIRNPFGIYKLMRDYARANGTQHTRNIDIKNQETGEIETHTIDDYYQPNDPDEYVICIVDHMALLTPEKDQKDVRDAMIKLSSDYMLILRNKYKYILVPVIQQAAAQESNENAKMGKLKPTLDGYGEAKIVSRDADIVLGLFSPYRHGMRDYEGYNIERFRDNIRFLELIVGREGGGGNVCPLLFDGGTNFFQELPLPTETEQLEQSYALVNRIRDKTIFY